jgi:histidinol-phosphatase (PHP family)
VEGGASDVPLYDQHLHSRHSIDCRTEPRANVEAAIARGLAGLTFTEHFDTHPLDFPRCVFHYADYSAAIDRLRDEFGGRIFIGKGIEVCYQPQRMDFILNFLERHSFDLVMVSVHYFSGLPVHEKENWEGIDPVCGTRQYLEDLLEAVRFVAKLHASRGRVFDVLGHLDLVKRYTLRYYGSYDVTPCADLIDEILRTCLAADLTPEINTSSLRQGLDEPMPNAAAVRRYAELGGTAVSIGSDSHRAEDIGAGFDVAEQMVMSAGLQGLAVFKDRRRSLVRFVT